MQSISVYRLTVYLVVLFALLALPFLIAVGLFRAVPDPYVISPAYLAPDKATFNLEAFKANPKFADVQRLRVPGHGDHILLTSEGDLLRLVMPGAEIPLPAVARKANQDAREMKSKSGITAVGEESSSVGGTVRMLTKFSDGSASFEETAASTVLQVITRNPARARTYFKEIGVLVENTAISGWQAWFGRNTFLVVVALALAFAGTWLAWIFKGGCWVAAVDPRPGTAPLSAAELKDRLLKINDLEVPFRILEKRADILTAEWRLDGKWRGLLESEEVGILATLDMKLQAGRRAVSVVETQRKWVKEQGVFSRAGQFSFFRGIRFASYDAGAVYGLSYVNGEFKVTGYQYKFNIQEVKNPLIELVTSSGWRWEPHLVFV